MSTSYQSSYNYKVSIIRKRGNAWQVETNRAGRRRRCTKSTRREAETYAAAAAEQTREDGARALELTGPEREEAIRALKDFPTEAIRGAAKAAFEIIPNASEREDVSDALGILRGDVSEKSLQKPRHTPTECRARRSTPPWPGSAWNSRPDGTPWTSCRRFARSPMTFTIWVVATSWSE